MRKHRVTPVAAALVAAFGLAMAVPGGVTADDDDDRREIVDDDEDDDRDDDDGDDDDDDDDDDDGGVVRVDPLRGRWDLTAELPEVGTVRLRLFVADVEPDPAEPSARLANGCIKTLSTGVTAPISLRAVDLGDGTSDVTFLGTIVVDGFEPAVATFTGVIDFGGKRVRDDVAAGFVGSNLGEGPWNGSHRNKRPPKCPTVDPGELSFSGDAYTAQNAQDTTNGGLILEGITQIVSNGMLVESPSIGSVVAPPFTDLFTPGVDFVTEFRYLASRDGVPPIGEQYTFTLLDALGQPIPGTESTDVWNGCFQGAPQNIQGTYVFEQFIDLSWDAVTPAQGFDPANGRGFYQIESDGGYGAAGITAITHRIPWAPFGGFAPGVPDGVDFGISLSEFGDGAFNIDVISFSDDVGPGGVGTACQVRDQSLPITISGSDVIVGSPPA